MLVHNYETRLIQKLNGFEISPFVEQIECPTLLTTAEGDPLAIRQTLCFKLP
jgi:hypothetical protein